MTTEKLFELLPLEIQEHFNNGGTYEDLKENIHNYLEYLDEGADRVVFELNEDYVVKFELGNDQSIREYHTYHRLKEVKEKVTTEIFSNTTLSGQGLIFAERVTPMEEYFSELWGSRKEEGTDNYLVDYVEEFSADRGTLEWFMDLVYYEVSESVLQELDNFVDLVDMYNLHDMHVGNIGVDKNGVFVALDLGC